MENKYINYDNALQVLNEGFFDFVKKMVARLFHALFKAKKYEDLSDRLDKIEQIIKYGNAKINESDTTISVNNINETIRHRSRIVEAGDSSSKKDSSSAKDSSVSTKAKDSSSSLAKDSSVNTKAKDSSSGATDATDTSKGKSADEIGDTSVTSSPVKVNLNNINPNIPSFPAVAKKLVDALASQLTSLKKSVPESKIISDISKVRAGAKLPANYAQQLELVATNFLRKYSGGGIALPQPKKGENMTSAELNQWRDLLTKNKTMVNMDSFRSISDSMRKVIDVYKQEFTTYLNEFNAREDRHIQQNKDGKASTSDLKFKTDWNTKLNYKMNSIVDSCTDFIPTAINEYIIKSGIYKGALDYISKIIELLFANTNVVEMDNILLNMNSKIQNSEITENMIARSKNLCLSNLNSYLTNITNAAQQPQQAQPAQPAATPAQNLGTVTQAPAQPANNEASAPATTPAPAATPAPATAAVNPAVPANQPTAPAPQQRVRTTTQTAPAQPTNPQQSPAQQAQQPNANMQRRMNVIKTIIGSVNNLNKDECVHRFLQFKSNTVYKTLSQVKGLDGAKLSQSSAFNNYIDGRINELIDVPDHNDGNIAISLLIMLHSIDNTFTHTYSTNDGEKIKFI